MKKNSTFIATLILAALTVIFLCAWWGDAVVALGTKMGLHVEKVSLGDWGDSFSALNTAFSGMALVGIGATIYMQLQFSRRQQVENGKSEFERVFFQLFGLIRELRNELRFSPDAAKTSFRKLKGMSGGGFSVIDHADQSNFTEKKGVEAIKAAFLEISKSLEAQLSSGASSLRTVERIYRVTVNRRYEPEFSPYFRAIYSLLKRIDSSVYLSSNEKLDYSRLVRSQMTSQEAILLGLNGLSSESKDLMDYIIKYRMLKYSQEGNVKNELRKLYPEEAFKGR
ncbi:putative phage abortive infection protein [Paracoccus angustae]|uniref:Phage abortive infection protein n=1 Tax=Paracoccus angustae TaxID=1671480 RepID=A0ABV7U9B1_9RHOB